MAFARRDDTVGACSAYILTHLATIAADLALVTSNFGAVTMNLTRVAANLLSGACCGLRFGRDRNCEQGKAGEHQGPESHGSGLLRRVPRWVSISVAVLATPGKTREPGRC